MPYSRNPYERALQTVTTHYTYVRSDALRAVIRSERKRIYWQTRRRGASAFVSAGYAWFATRPL
jgi:hypothetical protein